MKTYKELQESLIPSGKAKGKLRRYAKLRSGSAKAAIPADVVGNLAVGSLAGTITGHPHLGTAAGIMGAYNSVRRNLKTSSKFGKIAKRLDRERKRK